MPPVLAEDKSAFRGGGDPPRFGMRPLSRAGIPSLRQALLPYRSRAPFARPFWVASVLGGEAVRAIQPVVHGLEGHATCQRVHFGGPQAWAWRLLRHKEKPRTNVNTSPCLYKPVRKHKVPYTKDPWQARTGRGFVSSAGAAGGPFYAVPLARTKRPLGRCDYSGGGVGGRLEKR